MPDGEKDSREGREKGEIAGRPLEVELDSPCIACGRKGVVNIVSNLDLPYLGEAMQTTYVCRSCGFKHSDLITLENRGAIRYEAFIEKEEDLSLRVVRSNSGTIRIPEIGVEIEPGLASESFISNTEGVLDRIEEVVRILMSDAELDVHMKCEALLEKLGKMKSAEVPFHLVVEDPYGSSAILGDGVRKTAMSEEEAAQLKKGEITLDFKPVRIDESRRDAGSDDADNL